MNSALVRITVLAVAALMVALAGLQATDDPHGSTNAIYCEQCHVGHNSLGDILINATDSLVATLCLSCHTPGGWVAMTKVLSPADQADPGNTGTSHRWDAPADNADRGASLPGSQALLDHLSADSRITCATCHDPHSNANAPFLRLDNSADALCLDCHSNRNVDSVRTYTGQMLSHPVGMTIPSANSDYHSTPLDVDGNPQPSDGNTTNDFNLLSGTTVSCTSCHGIHYTDSDPATVDGP
jgi:predicted CXXCH cytochrome family protein